jgi:hypothetical protein
MTLPYILEDYDVEGFLPVAAAFGRERFGYVVTPNVDHLIRYHDDPAFRALYADATYVLPDSQFLSRQTDVVVRAPNGWGTTTIAATPIPIQQYELALVRVAIPEAAPANADRLPLNVADGG